MALFPCQCTDSNKDHPRDPMFCAEVPYTSSPCSREAETVVLRPRGGFRGWLVGPCALFVCRHCILPGDKEV